MNIDLLNEMGCLFVLTLKKNLEGSNFFPDFYCTTTSSTIAELVLEDLEKILFLI